MEPKALKLIENRKFEYIRTAQLYSMKKELQILIDFFLTSTFIKALKTCLDV